MDIYFKEGTPRVNEKRFFLDTGVIFDVEGEYLVAQFERRGEVIFNNADEDFFVEHTASERQFINSKMFPVRKYDPLAVALGLI